MATISRYNPIVSPMKDHNAFIEGVMEYIQNEVDADTRVESPISGGVDSSVVTKLVHRAIGDLTYGTHIDTGFMRIMKRREESEIVSGCFPDIKNFGVVDARDFFYKNVMGVQDAEDKRKAFIQCYITTLNNEMKKHGCKIISQGTIKPDIIETDGHVKSQHNVNINFEGIEKQIEPLAGLYKHEVRAVAKALGLKEEAYLRQPFPGPGLSVRTVGVITPEKLMVEKQVNDIVEQTLNKYMMKEYGVAMYFDPTTGEQIPFQGFAATFDNRQKEAPDKAIDHVNRLLSDAGFADAGSVLKLNIKATGVTNGKRRYAPILCIALRDEVPYDVLVRIGKEVPLANRCSRALIQIESVDNPFEKDYLVSIRIVRSTDAITAVPMDVPLDALNHAGEWIIGETNKVGAVYYDITPKPPATIEYE